MDYLHPLIQQWFDLEVGQATEIQKEAWRYIAGHQNILISAPTGSGKTLSAFLFAINQLVTGTWNKGQTHVLYISPLKALNNDIQRNLMAPLDSIGRIFRQNKKDFPDIRVAVRSGDTPARERRKMRSQRPEILITTPESLNVLLTSASNDALFDSLKTVILDELHAIIGSKRGTHLILAVERLVRIAGDFQRIILSATVNPPDRVAAFAAGSRPIRVIKSAQIKKYDISLHYPQAESEGIQAESVWDKVVRIIKPVIARNKSTLIFVNSRRLCEKLTLKLNENEPELMAYSHHGSLSRELRMFIERKLKSGELKAIVATNTLELGIDIGALDEVILVQSPASVSSAIQRIGRAGHGVGQKSRALMIPVHPWDLVESAVLLEMIRNSDIEQIRPVKNALDVLAQTIVSMAACRKLTRTEALCEIRSASCFSQLPEPVFDSIIEMLNGRYSDSRINELKPRIRLDRSTGVIEALPGAAQAVYMGGGTIPNRGYFKLRHNSSAALIGELDEEFVWEARTGQSFDFGTQTWRIERITQNDVFVTHAPNNPETIPFWKAEEQMRDFHYSEAILRFLEEADRQMEEENLLTHTLLEQGLDLHAAQSLEKYLQSQRRHTQSPLPHRHHILCEYSHSGPGKSPGSQIFLHTIWGLKVNRPFSMALQSAWIEKYHQHIEIFSTNDCIVLVLPSQVIPEDILTLVDSLNLMPLLKKSLDKSGFFGARFRENAQRALLLGQSRYQERFPLWMSRLKSQKLLSAVQNYSDFPILVETWRTCLEDEFDIENTVRLLDEIHTGAIRITITETQIPSPFASRLEWRQINELMYRDDTPAHSLPSQVQQNCIDQVLADASFYPQIPSDLTRLFQTKLQRSHADYTPLSINELLHHLYERIAIPQDEWNSLLKQMSIDLDVPFEKLKFDVQNHHIKFSTPSLKQPLIILQERAPVLQRFLTTISADTTEPSSTNVTITLDWFLTEWLKFYGAVTAEFIEQSTGISSKYLLPGLDALVDEGIMIHGRIIRNDQREFYCIRDNYETLLRQNRSARRRSIPIQPFHHLPYYMALYHNIVPRNRLISIENVMDRLTLFQAGAGLWESEILPARLPDYTSQKMDGFMNSSGLIWIGRAGKQLMFCYPEDLDLIKDHPEFSQAQTVFRDPEARYNLSTLVELDDSKLSDIHDQIWELAWNGIVSNDTYQSIRLFLHSGMVSGKDFSQLPLELHLNRRHSRRRRYPNWRPRVVHPGNWFLIPYPTEKKDMLQEQEIIRDRIRILMDRYGLLFREALDDEMEGFKWKDLIPVLRVMELAGELTGGHFFEGINGIQYAGHEFLALLSEEPETAPVYWMHSMDPVSPSRYKPNAATGHFPNSSPATHLVFKGADCVLISQGNGKNLTVNIAPDDPALPDTFCVLDHLMTRNYNPVLQIKIETINSEPAIKSPYSRGIRDTFDISTGINDILLHKKM